MTQFKYNKETGVLEAWRDGKKVGTVATMGDKIMGNELPPKDDRTENPTTFKND